MNQKCSTIGCKRDATHVLTYSFQESRDQQETDLVCIECGQGYLRRPSLKANLVHRDQAAGIYLPGTGPRDGSNPVTGHANND